MKARELKNLVEQWGNPEVVLKQLHTHMQVASRFMFDVRAPSSNNKENAELREHAKDAVSSC
ncbi:MAG: hypothetical protein ABJL67_00005 [Sulfitobacter sp.]